MNLFRFTIYAASIAFFCTATFTSCKKDVQKVITTEETDSDVEDQADMDLTFEGITMIADQAEEEGTSSLKGTANKLTGCATVTHDTTVRPRKMIIDFGSTNCLCNDGRNRRGKIIVSYTGRYRDSGYTRTVTFDSFYVNDNRILGSKEMVNRGRNQRGLMYFDVTVNGRMVKVRTGDTVTRTSNQVRTWINGENTRVRPDDVYEITGGGSITKGGGRVITINITTALEVAVSCNWIRKGVMAITPQGASPRTLDYGNGNCDNQATITANNNTRTITLP